MERNLRRQVGSSEKEINMEREADIGGEVAA